MVFAGSPIEILRPGIRTCGPSWSGQAARLTGLGASYTTGSSVRLRNMMQSRRSYAYEHASMYACVHLCMHASMPSVSMLSFKQKRQDGCSLCESKQNPPCSKLQHLAHSTHRRPLSREHQCETALAHPSKLGRILMGFSSIGSPDQ